MMRTTISWTMAVVIGLGLMLGGLHGEPLESVGWLPMAWAQDAPPSSLPKVNRDLPGGKTGVLTNAKDGTVRIDRRTYVVAPGALVEDVHGTPLSLQGVVWEDVELSVKYWLGEGELRNQIVQVVVTLAE